MHTTDFFEEPHNLFQTGNKDNAFAFVTDLGPYIHIELQRDTRRQRQMQFFFSLKCSANYQSRNTTPMPIPVSPIAAEFSLFAFQVLWKSCRVSAREHQCDRDFLPFSMRRRSTSMPPCVLSLLIHPCVLFRLMFLGWYSVPLFLVRTCW